MGTWIESGTGGFFTATILTGAVLLALLAEA